MKKEAVGYIEKWCIQKPGRLLNFRSVRGERGGFYSIPSIHQNESDQLFGDKMVKVRISIEVLDAPQKNAEGIESQRTTQANQNAEDSTSVAPAERPAP